EAGQTRQLTISYYRTIDTNNIVEEVETKKFGGKRKSTPNVPTHNRFKEEYVLTSASSFPVEEPEEEFDDDGNPVDVDTVWYKPIAVKKAIKVRMQKLEEMEKNPSKQTAKPTSIKAAKQAQKDRMKAGMKTGGVAPFDDIDSDDDIF